MQLRRSFATLQPSIDIFSPSALLYLLFMHKPLRAFACQIDLVGMKRIYRHPLPPRHAKSSLGMSLSPAELEKRAVGLHEWLGELVSRCEREGWSAAIQDAVAGFIDGSATFTRGSITGVNMTSPRRLDGSVRGASMGTSSPSVLCPPGETSLP